VPHENKFTEQFYKLFNKGALFNDHQLEVFQLGLDIINR